MSDHVLSGHSEGPWGNCGNTTVVQSMGMAEVMANMRLAEFKVACEGNESRSCPEYFVKISFPTCSWLGNWSSYEASRWAAALVHIWVHSYLCLNFLHWKIWICIQSSVSQSRHDTKDTMRMGELAQCGGDMAIHVVRRRGHVAPVLGSALTARISWQKQWLAASLLLSQSCRYYPQATENVLGQLKFGQFRWYATLLLQSSLWTSQPFLGQGNKQGNLLNALAY